MLDKTKSQVAVRSGYDGVLPSETTGIEWGRKVAAMRKDPTLALVRQLIVAPMLSAEWSYESEDEDTRQLLEDSIEPHRIHLVRNTMRGWLDYGWQGFEKVWRIDDDGRALIKKFKPLLQGLTEILTEDDGSYAGLAQPGDSVVLQPLDTLLLSYDVEGTNWYGQAIMKAAEEPHTDWCEGRAAASKYEKRVSGTHWVVHYPTSPGQTMFNGQMTSNYEVALAILSGLEANGRIAMPRTIDETLAQAGVGPKDIGWNVELLTDGGSGAASFTDRLKYADVLKVRALGLPERALLEGQFGTKAEAAAHADFAITNIEQRLKDIVEVINKYIVGHLLEVNFGDFAPEAKISAAPIEDERRQFLQSVFEKLLSTQDGLSLLAADIDTDQLNDQLGLPVRKDEELTEEEATFVVQPNTDDVDVTLQTP